MRGASRSAAIAGHQALDVALASGADATPLAEDLFGIAGALDSSASLRRALADPSREGDAKRGLVRQLFGGKISEQAADILDAAVGQRWSTDRDLSDTLESLGVEAVLSLAERSGHGDAVEDELFRFERIVAGDPQLRDAITDRNAPSARKAELVHTLLEGKVSPETMRLARQAVLAPRGRRFDRVLEEYLALAARRREQLTAVVTMAVDLDETQRERLQSALERIYSKTIQLQVVSDPHVLGGIRVQVGDEVVDGTILRRLEAARRHLAG